jgi:hypothetical protein
MLNVQHTGGLCIDPLACMLHHVVCQQSLQGIGILVEIRVCSLAAVGAVRAGSACPATPRIPWATS